MFPSSFIKSSELLLQLPTSLPLSSMCLGSSNYLKMIAVLKYAFPIILHSFFSWYRPPSFRLCPQFWCLYEIESTWCSPWMVVMSHTRSRRIERQRGEDAHLWCSANYWGILRGEGEGERMGAPQILFQASVPSVVLLVSSPSLRCFTALAVLHSDPSGPVFKRQNPHTQLGARGRHVVFPQRGFNKSFSDRSQLISFPRTPVLTRGKHLIAVRRAIS